MAKYTFGHSKNQMDIINIEHLENYSDQQQNAAGWFYGNDGKKQIAIFVCPFCQTAGELNGPESNHTIAPDGTVNPSVRCDCGKFHAYIKLLNYGK